MHTLIVTCHPYKGSFAAGLTERINEVLTSKEDRVTVLDLVSDHFDPVMDVEDLRLWSQGQYKDELVGTYQDAIRSADLLVFPFPIWWGTMPAILKGFLDKVLLPGFAYRYGENGELIGLLTEKKAVVITTMETPVDVFCNYFGNPVEGAFLKDTLGTCGIETLQYFMIDHIVSGGRAYAEQKREEIAAYFQALELPASLATATASR